MLDFDNFHRVSLVYFIKRLLIEHLRETRSIVRSIDKPFNSQVTR